MNFYSGHSPVIMVTTDENYQAIQATASLVNGAASAGGGRYEVLFNANQLGVWQVSYNSLQPGALSENYQLQGTMPVKVSEQSVDKTNYPADHIEPNWLPITDLSGLWW